MNADKDSVAEPLIWESVRKWDWVRLVYRGLQAARGAVAAHEDRWCVYSRLWERTAVMEQAGCEITGCGPKGKAIATGALEHDGKAICADVQSHVSEHLVAGSAMFTDALKSYYGAD
jgi:hypothetical protein